VVGYPPCPYINQFKELIVKKHGMKVVVGTHPIPEKYLQTHTEMNTWNTPEWKEIIKPAMADEKSRLAYN
jgi:hypothetical protein